MVTKILFIFKLVQLNEAGAARGTVFRRRVVNNIKFGLTISIIIFSSM